MLKVIYPWLPILSICLAFSITGSSQTSETFQVDGKTYRLGYDRDAKYRDFTIPSDLNPATGDYNQLTFSMRGGDGGRRRVGGICTEPGGKGARVTASFAIGYDQGELEPGGTIRLIVGQQGRSIKSSSFVGAGGGGGSGILYKKPGANISTNLEFPKRDFSQADTAWILLAVAGGGGGPYAPGVCTSDAGAPGKPGNAETSGSDGKGLEAGSGGSNGEEGGTGLNAASGGGGGYLSGGNGGPDGVAGGLTGGSGGSDAGNLVAGGYGYGGGGSGSRNVVTAAGGAGGGYSGGGGGSAFYGGGGGGSYANPKAVYSLKRDGKGTDRTPNNGYISYRFELNDNLVDAPIANCQDVIVSISGDEERLLVADANTGSYDPNNRALTILICDATATCSPAWGFDCNDIGSAYSYTLQVDNGSQVSYCDFEVEIEQGATSTFTCPTSSIVQLYDCVSILQSGREYGGSTVSFEPQNYPACNTTLDYYILRPDNSIDSFHATDSPLTGIRSDTFDIGTSQVFYTAAYEDEEAVERTQNCSFTVTVNPIAISLDCPADVRVSVPSSDYDPENPCFVTVEDRPGADYRADLELNYDDCGDISYRVTGPVLGAAATEGIGELTSFDFEQGTSTVEYTVLRKSGESYSCSFTVEIDSPSTSGPSFTSCPSSGTSSVTIFDGITEEQILDQIDYEAIDDCGITRYEFSGLDLSCSEVGIIQNAVRIKAYDGSGRSEVCSFDVRTRESVAPVALCQGITVNLDENGSVELTSDDIDNGSYDDCGQIGALDLDITSFDCTDIGNNTVKMTATDNSGNTNSCTATVTVVDAEAPIALCQNLTINLDDTGNASITANDVDNGSSDLCGLNSLSLDIASFSCAEIGSNTVTLTATDLHSNSSTCTAIVTVVDVAPPTALCKNLTIELDESGQANLTAEEVDDESADGCGIANLAIDLTTFSCTDIGSNTVTLTVTDLSNNSTTCSATVTVMDAVAPIAICQDKTVQLDEMGKVIIVFSELAVGSTDNCAIDSYGITLSQCDPPPATLCFDVHFSDQIELNCSDLGQNDLDIQVFDKSGNMSSCTSRVIVIDPTLPTALCQDLTVSLDDNGSATITPDDINNGSTDLCGIANLTLDLNSFNCDDIGDHTVTLTVTDNGNNSTNCTATVTVEDLLAPIVSCQDLTVELDENGAATIGAADVAQGSADACGIAELALDIAHFSCDDIGDHTVIVTATDNNQNSNTCTATIYVVDPIAPIAKCQDLNIGLDENGLASITADDINDGSSDACRIAELALDITHFNCDDIGDNTVTLTVIDNNENINTCTAIVNVIDPIAPIANCQNLTIELDENGLASITADDIDNGSADACGIADLAADITHFNCNDIGDHTVTLTVTDNNIRSSTCTALVTIVDPTAPTANCQDLTVELDENGLASITADDIDNGSADACGIADLTLDITHFSCDDIGDHTVILTVTDNSEHTNTCTANVTIMDSAAPIAKCQDLNIGLDENGLASITVDGIDNGSADACGIAELAIDITHFNCEDIGDNTVTLTVIDNNENIKTCTAIVNVVDPIAPTANCQNLTIELDQDGLASITADDIDNGSFDACGIAGLGLDITHFNCEDIGDHTVTLTVSSNHLLSSTCTATVTIVDPTAPTANCQDLTVELDDDGLASISPDDIDNGSADACGIANLGLDTYDFDCNDLGEQVVSLSVTDNNGNGNTCTALITVEDVTAPEVVCQDISIVFNGEESLPVLPTDIFLAAESFDACGPVSFVSQSQSNISCSEVGNTLSIVVTAIDPSGNANSCTALVSVDGMPCGFTEMSIGCESGANTTYDVEQDQFTISSNGCFDYPDESISYVGTSLCGDGEIVIHLKAVEGLGYAGIVMRESLAPGSRMVGIASNLTRNVRSEYRVSTNGNLFRSTKRRSGAEWFKITRDGQKIKSYTSKNGTSWKLLRTVNLPNMPACLQVGIQAYSISKSETFTAIIDDFIINGSGVTSTYTRTAIPSTTTRVAPNIQLNPQIGGIRFQVAPNPFQGQTSIRFALSQRDEVQLQVFNLLGQQVKSWQEQTLEAGEYHFDWKAKTSNGQTLDAGIYLVRLRIGKKWFTKKVSLLR